eukprot:Colp12_sorted_trinity150504_noHs@9431
MTNLTQAVPFVDDFSWLNTGDTAFVLVSTGLVFLMTLGLAFFYSSLVHDQHTVDTMLKTIISMGLVTVQWVLFGYSLAFSPGNSFIGDGSWALLQGLATQNSDDRTREMYAPTIPSLVFMVFQMSFAVITPSLICGSIVGRMKFSTLLIFLLLWSVLVYDFVAHWVWSSTGWLHDLGALDFAGGSVVHIASGFSALVASKFVGRRNIDWVLFETNNTQTMAFNLLGAALLWFGWFGFNGGSALGANHVAGVALVNTQICAGTAMLTWALVDLCVTRSPTLEGAIYGAVVGLVTITPACGYVLPGHAIIMGIIAALFSYCVLKVWTKYAHLKVVDDSLFVFCSHGLAGFLGALLTGLFATTKVNEAGKDGAFYGNGMQFLYQLADAAVVAGWASAMTAIILFCLKHTIGLYEDDKPHKLPPKRASNSESQARIEAQSTQHTMELPDRRDSSV